MVRRATDTNVASAERIVPMLDLCQLYWDTDALLIQACAGLTQQQHLARVFYVPSNLDAVTLALEIRFATQEQFAVRNMRSSSGPDSLQTQSYVMFRPGLRQQCVSDNCTCEFDARASKLISEAVSICPPSLILWLISRSALPRIICFARQFRQHSTTPRC